MFPWRLSVAYSCLSHLPFLSSLFLRERCLHFATHKRMNVSLPMLFTLPEMLSVWFWSLWAAVALQWWLMSVLASFQAQHCHFSCCSRPVSVVTVAPRSAVQEDYWTGLEWCKRLAGKYNGFVLAYWYFPIELNGITRCFQGSTDGKFMFLNNRFLI